MKTNDNKVSPLTALKGAALALWFTFAAIYAGADGGILHTVLTFTQFGAIYYLTKKLIKDDEQ